MQAELLREGVELTLVGMGTVAVFLSLLVGAIVLMSRVVMRLHGGPGSAADADAEVAAITAAIKRHRGER